MKWRFLFFLLVLFRYQAQSQTTEQKPDPNFHIYLLAGQSNMAGRATVEAIDTTTVINVLVFDKNLTWQKAKEPLHWDKPTVVGTGPGFAFGRDMIVHAGKDIKIGLIPAAKGGSSITNWVAGVYHAQTNSYPYDEALLRAKAARQAGILAGIIWHQGETDSTPEAEALHLERLKDLVQRFRADLGLPDLPFIAGELGYFNAAYISLNKVINQLPGEVPNTVVVSAQGLTHKGDNTHFDLAAAHELGKRYAQAMRNLLKLNAWK